MAQSPEKSNPGDGFSPKPCIRSFATAWGCPPERGSRRLHQLPVKGLLLLLLLLSAVAIPLFRARAQEAPRLYVYIPSYIRPYVIQKRLQDACPGLNITAFGDHREFGKAIINSSPDAILALERVVSIEKYEMYEPLLVASKEGKRYDRLSLISVGKPISRERYAEISVGVVDILGRRKMKAMLRDFLDLSEEQTPKIKYVSRLEDLLSVLQVNEAEAILVQQDLIERYFLKRSKLDLKVTALEDARMGLAVMAVHDDVPQEQRDLLVREIRQANPELFERLGVERWESP